MSLKPSLDMTEEELALYIGEADNYSRDKVLATPNTYLAADLRRSDYSHKRSFISKLVSVIRAAEEFSVKQWQAISDLVVSADTSNPELQSSIMAKMESNPSTGLREILKCLRAVNAKVSVEFFSSFRHGNDPEIAIDLATLAFSEGSDEWPDFFESLVHGDYGRFTKNVMKSRYSTLVEKITPLTLMIQLKKASEMREGSVDISDISQYVAKRAGIRSETARAYSSEEEATTIMSPARREEIASRSRKIGNLTAVLV